MITNIRKILEMEEPEEICNKKQGTYDDGELVISSASFEEAIGERNKIK